MVTHLSLLTISNISRLAVSGIGSSHIGLSAAHRMQRLHSTDIESMSQTHMVSTYRPSTITPVHRPCPRPPSDTRYSLSRVNSQSSATACPEGSTGRSRLCRRSESPRTRHGPHERTSEPKAHARPSMWRPCSPDGEVCIGPRPPLRDPAPNLAKTASSTSLELLE